MKLFFGLTAEKTSRGVFLLFLFTSFLGLSSVGDAHGQQKRRTVSVVVDPNKTLGQLPSVYRTSSYHWFIPDPQTMAAFDLFLAENKVGTIGIMLDTVLETSKNHEDLVRNLSKWDPVVKKVLAKGGKVLFEIWSTPLWISSDTSKKPDHATYESKSMGLKAPPKEYEKWSEIIFDIVDHFNNKLKADALYQIWAEPDLHWLGREEEYLKLYKYSVLGARKADPKAKIGGPAVSYWDARFQRITGPLSKNPAILNFIQYCAKTPLPELSLTKLPVDFVIWHGYNLNPFSASALMGPANTIRKWLEEAGYPKATELILGEWNSWQETGKEHPYFSPEHDSEFGAAYSVAMLDAMARAEIHRHLFATLFDGTLSQSPSEFVGMFGLFTKHYVTKPVYNGFRAVSILGEDVVETQVNDDFLITLATREGNQIVLLIVNFFPDKKMHENTIFSRTSPKAPVPEREYKQEELQKAGLTRQVLADAVANKVNIQEMNMPAQMKKDVGELVSYLQRYSKDANNEKWRTREPIEVSVQLKDLPYTGDVHYTRYLVGPRHSNGYAVRSKIEASLKQGKKWNQINKMPEITLQAVETQRIRKNAKFDGLFSLEPYSVTVLVFSEGTQENHKGTGK